MVFNTFNSFIIRATSSPSALSLGLGLATSSYFFWGNVATYFMGPITIAVDKSERQKLGLSTKNGLEIWAWFYKRGAKHMGISGVVSALSVMYAALKISPSTLNGIPLSRNYLWVISLTLLSSGIYTVLIMLPTNNRLLSICAQASTPQSSSDASKSTLTTAQTQEVEALLLKWKNMHYVRLVTGAIGWMGTLAAYTMIV